MSDRRRCCRRPVSGFHEGGRLNWLRITRRPPVHFGADAGLVSLGRGRRRQRPRLGRGRRLELLRLRHGGPVDLGLHFGLDGDGVIMALVLPDRYPGQDGSAHDHGHRGYVRRGPKATTVWRWLP
jgi:hypothetical protein